jgi:hypothetical protein
MHLKFDNKLLTWIFAMGLLAGGAAVISLIALFNRF